MLRLLTASVLLGQAASAVAQTTEDQQRAACTGDAFRVCASSIPDRDRVRDCLIANRDRISAECRAVLPRGRIGPR